MSFRSLTWRLSRRSLPASPASSCPAACRSLATEQTPPDRQLPPVRACWRYSPGRYCRRSTLLVMRVALPGAGMKQHRVAILGGAGFIGRYVVKRLAERGDVLAVGGRTAAAARFLKLKGDVGQV